MPNDPLSTSDLAAVRAAVDVLQREIGAYLWDGSDVESLARYDAAQAENIAIVLNAAPALLAMAEAAAREHDIIARAQKAVLNYYLLTGGQFVTVLNDMRKALGLPDEISDQERAATDGRYIGQREPKASR